MPLWMAARREKPRRNDVGWGIGWVGLGLGGLGVGGFGVGGLGVGGLGFWGGGVGGLVGGLGGGWNLCVCVCIFVGEPQNGLGVLSISPYKRQKSGTLKKAAQMIPQAKQPTKMPGLCRGVLFGGTPFGGFKDSKRRPPVWRVALL